PQCSRRLREFLGLRRKRLVDDDPQPLSRPHAGGRKVVGAPTSHVEDHRNMVDPRVKELAELLVGRSIEVQPGWQVMVQATALARPFVEELVRAIARRGACPLVRLSFTDLERVPFETVWALEAPEALLEQPAPLDVRTRNEIDAR